MSGSLYWIPSAIGTSENGETFCDYNGMRPIKKVWKLWLLDCLPRRREQRGQGKWKGDLTLPIETSGAKVQGAQGVYPVRRQTLSLLQFPFLSPLGLTIKVKILFVHCDNKLAAKTKI